MRKGGKDVGGKGILVRKADFDRTLNQLTIFMKGSGVVLVLYLINGFVIQKNLDWKSLLTTTLLYLGLVGIYLLFKIKKQKGKKNPIIEEICSDFNLQSFAEIKALDQQLIQQLRKNRRFVSNNNQVVGTDNFVLMDFRDGQFQLLKVKEIQALTISKVGKSSVVFIQTNQKWKKIFLKKWGDAKELVDALKRNYAI